MSTWPNTDLVLALLIVAVAFGLFGWHLVSTTRRAGLMLSESRVPRRYFVLGLVIAVGLIWFQSERASAAEQKADKEQGKLFISAFSAGVIVKRCPKNYRIKPALAAEQRAYAGVAARIRNGKFQGEDKAKARLFNQQIDELRNAIARESCTDMGRVINIVSRGKSYVEKVK